MTRPERFRAWADRNRELARQRDAQGEHVSAFEMREDVRDAQRLIRARQAGHTHSTCSCCGKERVLSWAGEKCDRQLDVATGICGGTYHATGIREQK